MFQDLRFKIYERGFTALEMLLVTGLIVLLLGGVVMIGFRYQAPKNRNTERRNEVNAIADALTQWSLDNGSPIPSGIPLSETCLGTDPVCYNISQYLVPAYLNQIPEDPKSTSGSTDIGYTIKRDSDLKVIIIKAANAEGEIIEKAFKYGSQSATSDFGVIIAPATVSINNSGIPMLVEISFQSSSPFKITDIDTSKGVIVRFQEPVLPSCSALSDGGGHYLSHLTGFEQYSSTKLHVKFNRTIVELCVKTGDRLQISGTFKDGNKFISSDTILVQ